MPVRGWERTKHKKCSSETIIRIFAVFKQGGYGRKGGDCD